MANAGTLTVKLVLDSPEFERALDAAVARAFKRLDDFRAGSLSLADRVELHVDHFEIP